MTAPRALTALLCLALGTACQAQTYDLTEHYATGQEIMVSSSMDMTMTMEGSGPKEFKEMLGAEEEMAFSMKGQVRYRILGATDGRPSRQEAKVLSFEAEGGGPMGGAPIEDCPILGKTVTVKLSKTDKKTFSVKGGKPEHEEVAKRLCDDLPAEILEDADVSAAKIGDSWKISGARLAERFELPEDCSAELTGTFEDVVEKDGKRLAQIAITISIKGKPGEIMPGEMAMDLSGYYFFDLDTSLPYYVDAKGTMTVSVSFGAGAGKSEITMNGDMRVVSAYQLVGQ